MGTATLCAHAPIPCSVEIKEVRMRPVTEEHDYQVRSFGGWRGCTQGG
jgi:hypothetical protein